MSDHGPEDPATETTPGPAMDPAPVSAEESATVQRRDFLRQLTGDAVTSAARLAGLTTVVRRTIVAAGEAATRELAPLDEEPPPVIASDATATATETSVAAPSVDPPVAAPPPAAPAPAPRPPAAVALSMRQEAILATAATAVLATNDPSGAPTLTSSTFHWDGTSIRIPSDLFAARVERIDADPRVSVLVTDDASGGWVAISGSASIVSGDAVEAEMLAILRKSMSDDEAARSWTELRASGNPVVIAITPTRYVWRLD